MSILDIGKSCVFSEVNGTLLFNGKPAAGALVKRTVEYQRKESDETTADAEGRFSLPAMYHRSIVKFLPAEFVAAQTLRVVYEGQEYEIWVNTKRKHEENSELGGLPLNLTCEITSEEKLHEEFDTLLVTKCVW